MKELDTGCTRKAKRAVRLAARHRVDGSYGRAEALYKRAFSLAVKDFDRDSGQAARVLDDLAVLYKYMGRFSDAGRLSRKGLFITKRNCSRAHPELGTIESNWLVFTGKF